MAALGAQYRGGGIKASEPKPMTAKAECPHCGARRVDSQLGLEATPAEYIATMAAVFREVRRVLRVDGTLWLNMGDSYASNMKGGNNNGEGGSTLTSGARPHVRAAYNDGRGRAARVVECGLAAKQLLLMPARLALALQADGWWLRSDIIWAKPNPMPESVTDRPTSAHEHVFLLTKSARYYFDAEAVREPPSDIASIGRRSAVSGLGNGELANGARFGGGESGRNLRNVWEIATAPFAEAHFATFPPELAERCIKAGTSERGCCAGCGAPWARVIDHQIVPGPKAARTFVIDERDHAADANDHGANRQKDGHRPGWISANTTTGWRASCACPEAPPVPCTVLDPFAGAGTTLLVADRLQRDGIGIELSADYTRMARGRVVADAPLLAVVR
jgi:DNA modification methylase